LDGLSEGGRAQAKALAEAGSLADAEARVASQSRRAREAEDIARKLAAIQARLGEVRAEAIARGDDMARADRARMEAEARAGMATQIANARREEIRALLAELEPPGQHGLFELQHRPRTAEQWIETLTARSEALTLAEERARAALDQARAAGDRAA